MLGIALRKGRACWTLLRKMPGLCCIGGGTGFPSGIKA